MSIEAISGANTTSSSANRLVAEEDASLVAAAKAKDTRAFELLVERNDSIQVFEFVAFKNGGDEPTRARDLLGARQAF
jgi:hypothetical protein